MAPVANTTPSTDGDRPRRILVVDDEPQILELLHDIFSRQGYEVLLAADGDEAWDLIAGGNPLEVVITDINMPSLSGRELLTTLRKSFPDLPVILITGAATLDGAVECMREGAFDYLSKPFDFDKLIASVEAAIMAGSDGTATPRPAGRGMIAGYRLCSLVGEGSSGVVFLARAEDATDGERFAVKVLKMIGLSGERREAARQRFLREADSISRIRHPNVIRFVDCGLTEGEGLPYLVMEFFEGTSLDEVLPKVVAMPVTAKTTLLLQVADALVAVHEANILHRDIKPSNLMIDARLGFIKLSDFGVARVPDSDLTKTGGMVGSPAYMAPEIIAGEGGDERSDIFSLGVLAYEIYCGRRPFPGQTVPQLMSQIPTMKPIAPDQVAPDIPPGLRAVLARMLRKAPDERFQSARDLREALTTCLNGPAPPAAENEAASDWAN